VNRADKIRAYALHNAAALALKAELEREAREEYEESGTRPTWTLPAARVSGATHHDHAEVADPVAFFDYLEHRFPTEVVTKTVREVRNQRWLNDLLEAWVALGPVEPPAGGLADEPPGVRDEDGVLIPGLKWMAGGGYKSTSITVDPAVKRDLAAIAAAYAAGTAELPTLTSG
jgi:hypothetical protein